MNVGEYGWKNALGLHQNLNFFLSPAVFLCTFVKQTGSRNLRLFQANFSVFVKHASWCPAHSALRDVFFSPTLWMYFLSPIMSALHHFTYPWRLTVSFNVCEHRPVNHNIFTLSSPAQAKVNLPLVHYRHDTGIPPPPSRLPSVPQEKVGDAGYRGERQGGRQGERGGGFERILYAALCIAFMLSSR